MIPINGRGKFKQGLYNPTFPQKYIGKERPVYRSSYELRLFRFLDTNQNVIEWASESLVIPYVSPLDKKVHRYFTDAIVLIKEGDKFTKYIIEVKPYKQTLPPVVKKKQKKATIIYEQAQYQVNQAKWAAAQAHAKLKNMQFLILTEKELGLDK